MNKMDLQCKIISDYMIEYEYVVSGEWQRYFTKDKFFVEYSIPIKGISNSIAVIPALGTFLPLAWIFDAKIMVEEIDEMFLKAIPEFKKGYIDMYQSFEFKGSLIAEKVVKNNNGGSKTAMLFSGGVDAFNTLLMHMDEKPDLITVWGADIDTDNTDGWNTVAEHREAVLKAWNLGGIIIKSSFRRVVSEEVVSSYTQKYAKDNWWHGFHHGIGMLTLSAPVAFLRGYQKLYVASSFTVKDKGKYTCASDPAIDNFVKFCGCGVVHDGYEFSRQDKIGNICEYLEKTNIKIPLRVCWESTEGSNCCKCEKCVRTMLGIYAEKKKPEKFGFECSMDDFLYIVRRSSKVFLNGNFKKSRYDCIRKRMRENYTKGEIANSLKWFYNTDTRILERWFKLKTFIGMVKRKILRILKIT